MGVIQGDTESLDYSSDAAMSFTLIGPGSVEECCICSRRDSVSNLMGS